MAHRPALRPPDSRLRGGRHTRQLRRGRYSFKVAPAVFLCGEAPREFCPALPSQVPIMGTFRKIPGRPSCVLSSSSSPPWGSLKPKEETMTNTETGSGQSAAIPSSRAIVWTFCRSFPPGGQLFRRQYRYHFRDGLPRKRRHGSACGCYTRCADFQNGNPVTKFSRVARSNH